MNKPETLPEPHCVCASAITQASNFYIKMLGLDTTGGRNGEVYLKSCRQCATLWIEYFYENEAFSQSGRWFRGIIPAAHALCISPAEVLQYLESLEWYLYGGSYFKNGPSKTSGRLHL
jgi:hypothetical protein